MKDGTININVLLLNILMNIADEEEIKFFSEWVKDTEHAEYFQNLKHIWHLSEIKSIQIPVSEIGRTQFLTIIKKEQAKLRLRRIVLASVSAAAAIIAVSFFVLNNQKDSHLQPQIGNVVAENQSKNQSVEVVAGDEVSIISSSSQGDVLKVMKFSGDVIKNIGIQRAVAVDSVISDAVIEINTLVVPKGKRVLMILSDSTKMWVNSDSKVTYPVTFPKDKRVVNVIGNVFFDVAKDKQRPFEVVSGSIKTTALGTQFEVDNYGGLQCAVSLLEGSVSVENDNEKVVIEPNHQVIARAGVMKLTEKTFDPDNYGLWRDNILVINHEPITKIIEKLVRWHNVQIENKVKGLEKTLFTGKLEEGTIEEHLKIIAENIKLKFAKEGNKIIIWN